MTVITWYREAPHHGASRPAFARWIHTRRQDKADAEKAVYLAKRFIAAASNLGLARDIESCAGIPGTATMKVRAVRLGVTCDRLLVELMPGQTPSDLRKVAPGLAEALHCHFVKVRRRSHGYVFLELQRFDPLDTRISLRGNVSWASETVLVGQSDDGTEVPLILADEAHMLVQGQTRSGKSRFLYGLFSQLSDAHDVLICGSDITALVLRPFIGTRHGHLIATGSAGITEHAEVLEELVTIMDDRIARIPLDDDVFPCTPDEPYMLTLLEELPGLLRRAAAEDAKAPRGSLKLVDRIKNAYGRLLAEGAKAGFRLVIVMQRADATIIGGYERGQCPLRISFSVDDRAAVRMLHPAASEELADFHCSALPGRALISRPGLPVGRFRSPEIASYQDYVTNVLAPLEATTDVVVTD